MASNLSDIDELSERTMLGALRTRFAEGLPYGCGEVCVFINPFYWMDLYSNPSIIAADERPAAPHIFAVASRARQALGEASQTVLITGESGAGKTEGAKLLIKALCFGAAESSVAEQLRRSSPLLEAFGNAPTPRNRNSSRFGKSMKIHMRDKTPMAASVTAAFWASRVTAVYPFRMNENFRLRAVMAGVTLCERHGISSAPSALHVKWGAVRGDLVTLGASAQQMDELEQSLCAILSLLRCAIPIRPRLRPRPLALTRWCASSLLCAGATGGWRDHRELVREGEVQLNAGRRA